MTKVPPEDVRANDRFRDLIDLLLLRGMTADRSELHEAARTVFTHRGRHTWPPTLQVPESACHRS